MVVFRPSPRIALFTCLLGSVILAAPAIAQDTSGPIVPKRLGGTPVATAPAWGKVTPKRIGVPVGGASKRITVQIRPADIARQQGLGTAVAANPVPVSTDPEVPADLQDWFWNAVPHDVTGAAPERFALALKALEAPQAVGLSRPSFQQVTDIANAYGSDLLVHSIGTNVSPALALAVMAVESAGKADAQSGAGAQGLMQLIPATAARFGVTDPLDPSQNIKGGIAYLDWLLTHFNGDLALALSGYNAGENAVSKHQGPPPYAETRAYVPKVLAAWQVARGLCVTPPDLYSDGCVFATNALRSE
ncbi:lytic transglycosylase domain-containing protein [Celeribacter sp.]|uniref:lytic transglycosylase domain-containing protein n=1 Tax=Celeribacter sp. TaxID=1890673 RepID=UPI003A954CA9